MAPRNIGPGDFGAGGNLFTEKIMAMANINVKGVDLVVTAKVNPKINRKGQMILKLDKVIVGAVNMTAVAKIIAGQAYQNIRHSEKYALTAQILASIIKNQPFEPVFEIDNKIDGTEFAYYYRQEKNGLYVRQALIYLLTGAELENE